MSTKIHWESFLSANNALTKNFLFNPHSDLIFCGLFLCPWSLGRPKKCLRGRFRTHWFIWKLFKEYLSGVQKSTFFQGVSPGFLVKIDQILKWAFFARLCPYALTKDLRVSRPKKIHYLSGESFLSANNALTKNALTKNFLFNPHSDLIFCGLFLCPWSLGRPKKCLRERFQKH